MDLANVVHDLINQRMVKEVAFPTGHVIDDFQGGEEGGTGLSPIRGAFGAAAVCVMGIHKFVQTFQCRYVESELENDKD